MENKEINVCIIKECKLENVIKVKLENVIKVVVKEGSGTKENPVRTSEAYFTSNGVLIGKILI